jgi:branched-chain amino acid transport system substrate-binding protein
MKRLARSTPLGVAAVGVSLLALAAFASGSAANRIAAPSARSAASASQAVTNYLAYTHGHKGKANPRKSKIHIGWINQQGGQVVIGALATTGAQFAVKYVNNELGGVDGHPLVLDTCFVKSAEEEGTTCGQKFANDKRISVIGAGAVATGIQSFYSTIHGAKPVIAGVATTPVDGTQKNAAILFGDTAKILLPFGTYARDVLHAKSAAIIYPNIPGISFSASVIAKGMKAAGISVKSVGYPQGQADLTAPLTAAGATTADVVIPYGTALDCVNQVNSLKQLGITDPKKIFTAPLCLNAGVIQALGDFPKWTFAIASSLFGDATDRGMPAYTKAVTKYKQIKNAPDPWFIIAFSQVLTIDRFLNEVSPGKITPAAITKRVKAFRGPLALGAPKLQCGKYKDTPGVCNDRFQVFEYQGGFKWKKTASWLGPPS